MSQIRPYLGSFLYLVLFINDITPKIISVAAHIMSPTSSMNLLPNLVDSMPETKAKIINTQPETIVI